MFNAASEVVVNGLAEVQELEKEVKTKKRVLMEAETLNKWEEETIAINPQYVIGSRRKATSEDIALLGHCHGQVCLISCQRCGQTRLVNVQDAKQTHFCKACMKEASKARSKTRRVSKKLSSVSKEALEAKIASLNAQIAGMR